MSVSKTKLIQSSLAALCEMGPKVKTWANLPNDMLYKIGLARIESREKGTIYLPREIENKVNEMLESRYSKEMQRSIAHYKANNIKIDDGTLYCQYGVLDTILLSY